MFEIETKELKISDELNRKIDMICRFACVKYEFIPGNIKSIKNTNIAYVKPHILKVKGNDYLILEEYDKFIIGLSIDYKKEPKKMLPETFPSSEPLFSNTFLSYYPPANLASTIVSLTFPILQHIGLQDSRYKEAAKTVSGPLDCNLNYFVRIQEPKT